MFWGGGKVYGNKYVENISDEPYEAATKMPAKIKLDTRLSAQLLCSLDAIAIVRPIVKNVKRVP